MVMMVTGWPPDRGVLAVVGQIAGQPGAVRGRLPDRRGRARRERIERGQVGQVPRVTGQHGAVRREDLRLGGRVEDRRGQHPGPMPAGRGLLDLGGVGAQLALYRAVGGVQLQPVHHHQPQHHRRGERQAGHRGDVGAHRAGTGPAYQAPPAPGLRAHAAGARGHASSRIM